MRTLVTMMFGAAMLMGPNAALAEGGDPQDAELLGAKTVGVLPVLATGMSRQETYLHVTAMVMRGVEANVGGDGAKLVPMEASDGGFAFAGESTSADVRILRFAFVLGGLASNAADAELFKQAVGFLESEREAIAGLEPRLIAAVDRYITGAKAGQVNAQALVDSLGAAEVGIANGPERAHGYYATGVWLGLSYLALAAGEPDPNFYGMAAPLATLLEEDAGFGGSDLALAKEVRALGELLSTPRASLAGVQRHLEAALAVEADAP